MLGTSTLWGYYHHTFQCHAVGSANLNAHKHLLREIVGGGEKEKKKRRGEKGRKRVRESKKG